MRVNPISLRLLAALLVASPLPACGDDEANVDLVFDGHITPDVVTVGRRGRLLHPQRLPRRRRCPPR